MSTETAEAEPKYGVTYNRSWATTAIAHPAAEGEHGDCVHCLHLTQDTIAKAIMLDQATATIERDGHSMTVHRMIGTDGVQYMPPEEQARRNEERRIRDELVKAGASARDLRNFAAGEEFECRRCDGPISAPGFCEACTELLASED